MPGIQLRKSAGVRRVNRIHASTRDVKRARPNFRPPNMVVLQRDRLYIVPSFLSGDTRSRCRYTRPARVTLGTACNLTRCKPYFHSGRRGIRFHCHPRGGRVKTGAYFSSYTLQPPRENRWQRVQGWTARGFAHNSLAFRGIIYFFVDSDVLQTAGFVCLMEMEGDGCIVCTWYCKAAWFINSLVIFFFIKSIL